MTEEVQAAEKFWIIQGQATVPRTDVGLKKDEEGILRCVGRVPHYHPVFLPRNSKLASLIVQQVHEQMLRGGVSITMCRMREKYWIPKLRSLAKTVIRNYKCSQALLEETNFNLSQPRLNLASVQN